MTELYVGLDLETTGLLDPKERIVELALVLYTGAGQRAGKFVRRWNPGVPIGAKALAVHGITFEQVSHLPLLIDDRQSLAAISTLISKATAIVAHNGLGFDKPFLEMEFARCGAYLPEKPWVDTAAQGRWATPIGKTPQLRELCEALRVPYDPDQAHGAEYDTDVLMDCFFKAYRTGFFTVPGQTVNTELVEA